MFHEFTRSGPWEASHTPDNYQIIIFGQRAVAEQVADLAAKYIPGLRNIEVKDTESFCFNHVDLPSARITVSRGNAVVYSLNGKYLAVHPIPVVQAYFKYGFHKDEKAEGYRQGASDASNAASKAMGKLQKRCDLKDTQLSNLWTGYSNKKSQVKELKALVVKLENRLRKANADLIMARRQISELAVGSNKNVYGVDDCAAGLATPQAPDKSKFARRMIERTPGGRAVEHIIDSTPKERQVSIHPRMIRPQQVANTATTIGEHVRPQLAQDISEQSVMDTLDRMGVSSHAPHPENDMSEMQAINNMLDTMSREELDMLGNMLMLDIFQVLQKRS